MGSTHRGLVGSRWAAVRRVVLDRDGYRCRECGRAGRLEVDHVKPLADGGAPFDPVNLQALCRSCHIVKTRRENAERNPVRPEVEAWQEAVAELL